jgi:hypothetical protein
MVSLRRGDFGGTAGDDPCKISGAGDGDAYIPQHFNRPLYFPQFSGFLFTMTQQNINSLAVSHIYQEALEE